MIYNFSHSFVSVNDEEARHRRKYIADRVSSNLRAIAEKAICRFYDIPSLEAFNEQAIQLRMQQLDCIMDGSGCPFNIRPGVSSGEFEIRDNSTGKLIFWCVTAQIEGDTTDITMLGDDDKRVMLTITVKNEYTTFDGKSEI